MIFHLSCPENFPRATTRRFFLPKKHQQLPPNNPGIYAGGIEPTPKPGFSP